MERLFSLLSDCMWETPIAQAKHAIQIKEKEQEIKLQVPDSSKKVFLDSTSEYLATCLWILSPLRDIVLSVIQSPLCTLSPSPLEEFPSPQFVNISYSHSPK